MPNITERLCTSKPDPDSERLSDIPLACVLSVASKRHKREGEGENDREPDPRMSTWWDGWRESSRPELFRRRG